MAEPESYQTSPKKEKETPIKECEEIVTGKEQFSYQRNSQIEIIEDIVISLAIPRPFSGEIITVEKLREIILDHKVPLATCLIAIMGLPKSGKTILLEKVLRLNIKLKDSATWSFDDYMKRKRNDKCMSLYELCILGGPPHHQYAWSFATKRYGAIFSIISSIVRTSMSFVDVKFEKSHTASTLVDEHLQWLLENTDYHLNKIKEEPDKITLLQDGLSLINVMDIGVNKALFDFLPIMMYFCRNLVRLAFLSLDRDGPNLHEPPELPSDIYGERKDDVVARKRSRLTYFLHLGYQQGHYTNDSSSVYLQKDISNNTVVIATHKDTSQTAALLENAKYEIQKEAKSKGIEQFFETWITADLDNDQSLKAVGNTIQELIKQTRRYQEDLPLRWIVLRSLIVSLSRRGTTPMILDKNIIVKIAQELEMNDNEVEQCLDTFTDFGSILYIHKFDAIKDLVIVDIWQFTQYLDKLFYPDDSVNYAEYLKKYGIIAKTSTLELLEINEKNFMKIITTFAMAAQVTNRNPVLLPNGNTRFGGRDFYYLPSAKVGTFNVPKEEEKDYAFLEIRSVNFPANVQAGISHEVMQNKDAFMIATEESNVSRFEFRPENGPDIRIEMIYEGSRTRLRVMNNISDVLASTTIKACSKVLVACCNCLRKKANLILNFKYNVGIPCCSQDNTYHFIYSDDKSDICEACKTDSPVRLCWIKAAEMMNTVRKDIDPEAESKPDMLTKGDNLRLKQEPLDLNSIYQVAKKLAEIDFDVETLSEKLNIHLDDKERNYPKDRQAITIIMKWESSMDGVVYKSKLAEVLKAAHYEDIAQILSPLSIVY